MTGWNDLSVSAAPSPADRLDVVRNFNILLSSQSFYRLYTADLLHQPISDSPERATEKRHKKTRISKAFVPEFFVVVKQFRFYNKPFCTFVSDYPVRRKLIRFSLRAPPFPIC